jgi:hypothetical protein
LGEAGSQKKPLGGQSDCEEQSETHVLLERLRSIARQRSEAQSAFCRHAEPSTLPVVPPLLEEDVVDAAAAVDEVTAPPVEVEAVDEVAAAVDEVTAPLEAMLLELEAALV